MAHDMNLECNYHPGAYLSQRSSFTEAVTTSLSLLGICTCHCTRSHQQDHVQVTSASIEILHPDTCPFEETRPQVHKSLNTEAGVSDLLRLVFWKSDENSRIPGQQFAESLRSRKSLCLHRSIEKRPPDDVGVFQKSIAPLAPQAR